MQLARGYVRLFIDRVLQPHFLGLSGFDSRRLYLNADPMTSGTFPVTTTAGGWMPVISLWNESFDPFGSDAQRAVVVSVGPPSLCAAGYACGAGSSEKTGLGTLKTL
jgi:hypothetical protein